MTLQIFFVAIASILAIVGNVPYLKTILTGKVKPHPYTWLLWSIVSLVTFFGALQKGAGLGVLPIAFSEIFTIIIFISSIKYGFKNIQHKDTLLLIIALLSFIPWYLTKDPTISVVIVVIIDLLAFIPTLFKTAKFPDTENPILFLTNTLRHILILFSIDNYNIATTLHSITMIATNSVMVFLITKKIDKKQIKQ